MKVQLSKYNYRIKFNLYNYALTTMVHTQLFPTFYLFYIKTDILWYLQPKHCLFVSSTTN